MKNGACCLGVSALRPREFTLVLDHLLKEIRERQGPTPMRVAEMADESPLVLKAAS